MKKLIYLLIFLPLLLQFCTKDLEPVKEVDNPIGKDTLELNDSTDIKDSIDSKDSIGNNEQIIKRKSHIIIGDTTGMVVTVFEKPDTLYGRYNVPQQKSFDLDIDGQPDLRLICSIGGSPGWGVDQGSSIEPLSDSTSILGFDNTDIVYYYYKVDTNRWGISTEIFYNTYLDSRNYYHSDSIYSSTLRTYPKVLNTSDSIAAANQWMHKKLTFRSTGNGGGYRQRTDDFEKHITYYTQTIKNINYGTWPYKSEQYVGIKYKNRLGWIKMNLLYESTMVVYEVALQR